MRVEALLRSGWLEINDDSSFPAIPTCYSWVTMQIILRKRDKSPAVDKICSCQMAWLAWH